MENKQFRNKAQSEQLEEIIKLMLGEKKINPVTEEESNAPYFVPRIEPDMSGFRIMSLDEEEVVEKTDDSEHVHVFNFESGHPIHSESSEHNLVTSEPKEMVNHPDHYNDTPIETIEMFYLLYHDRPEMIKGALLFNIFKYRDRYQKKNGQEDLNKMNWYLDELLTHFEKDTEVYRLYHGLKNI